MRSRLLAVAVYVCLTGALTGCGSQPAASFGEAAESGGEIFFRRVCAREHLRRKILRSARWDLLWCARPAIKSLLKKRQKAGISPIDFR